jgi:hypothetical protein
MSSARMVKALNRFSVRSISGYSATPTDHEEEHKNFMVNYFRHVDHKPFFDSHPRHMHSDQTHHAIDQKLEDPQKKEHTFKAW